MPLLLKLICYLQAIIDLSESQRLFGGSFKEHALKYYTKEKRDLEMCPKLGSNDVDINTVEVFKDFEFQVCSSNRDIHVAPTKTLYTDFPSLK